jgi:hypothetical protein
MKQSSCAALLALSLSLIGSRAASAQGCVLIRESAPLFGAATSTYQRPGEWELDVSFRDSTADRHYSLDVFQAQRTALGTYVINKQKQTLFSVSHAVTTRFSFVVNVPIVVASWSIPSPTTPTPGPRATQHGQGLGDISVLGRYWLLDPASHGSRNLSVGLGVKAPTGPSDETDTFVNLNGLNPSAKAVDQSVQPGDGGWGLQMEIQGFTRAGRAFAFGSVDYLANPQDVNGTPSILVGLGLPSTTIPLRNVNSVPDQYVTRLGVGVPLWSGFGVSETWRVEGVPRYDLIGRSDGFRRPGYEMFLETAVTYTKGKSTLAFNLPRAFYRYRAPDPYTGANGDATFPDWIAIGSYSYRFGSIKHGPVPTPAAPTT